MKALSPAASCKSLIMKFVVFLIAMQMSLFAGAADLDEILNWSTRPTIQDLIKNRITEDQLARILQPNGDRNGRSYDWGYWLALIEKEFPRVIATMEYNFPGATWATLGRDTNVVAEILDSFYMSLGQHDRVYRLGVSKASFKDADDKTLIRFLEDHGFSMKNILDNPPYILVDTVSSGGGRQGRTFVNAVYSKFSGRQSVSKILRKFNMFGLQVSTFRGPTYSADIGSYILTNEEKMVKSTYAKDYFTNHMVLNYVSASPPSNEVGYDHFTGAWHESYGSLFVNDEGRMVAHPGEPRSTQERRSVLWFMLQVHAAVTSKTFYARVQEEAVKLGYKFEPRRKTILRDLNGNEFLSSKATLQATINQGEQTLAFRSLEKAMTTNRVLPESGSYYNTLVGAMGQLYKNGPPEGKVALAAARYLPGAIARFNAKRAFSHMELVNLTEIVLGTAPLQDDTLSPLAKIKGFSEVLQEFYKRYKNEGWEANVNATLVPYYQRNLKLLIENGNTEYLPKDICLTALKAS